jgi:hypothetical protein
MRMNNNLNIKQGLYICIWVFGFKISFNVGTVFDVSLFKIKWLYSV